jgi:hypothetical protein
VATVTWSRTTSPGALDRQPPACAKSYSVEGASPRGREREDPGFIHRPGVVWIGQSVLIMSSRDASELAERLRRLGVRVAMAPMSIPRESLEAFRRPRA